MVRLQREAPLSRLVFLLLLSTTAAFSVPKFHVVSTSSSSIVIRLSHAANVTSFDARVHIFDLDTREEIRRTQIAAAHPEQLLSFDGLAAARWYALRLYYTTKFGGEAAAMSQQQQQYADEKQATKQELVVRTHRASKFINPLLIDDRLVRLEEVRIERRHVYAQLAALLADRPKLWTLVVGELRCAGGRVVKPLAQRVQGLAHFHFNLSSVAQPSTCRNLCLFPYIRVEIVGLDKPSGQRSENASSQITETFRARELCTDTEEWRDFPPSSSASALKTRTKTLETRLTTVLAVCSTVLPLLRLIYQPSIQVFVV